MRRVFLLGGALVAMAGAPAAASAATLTVSAPATTAPAQVDVTYSGVADAPGHLTVVAEHGGTTCAPTWGEQGSRPGSHMRTVNRAIQAGPISGTIDLQDRQMYGEVVPGGRYLLCGYISDTTRPESSAVAQSAFDYTALPPDVGHRVQTGFFNRLDLLNGVMLQYNGNCAGQGGCTGAAKPAGVVTVSIGASTKKKLKLRSTTLLQGPVGSCGDGGSFCAMLRASKAVKKALRKANDAAQRKTNGRRGVEVPATVTFKQTAPFVQTVTQKVTFKTMGATHRNNACKSSNARFPCSDFASGGGGGGGGRG
jgi:hypothetical protein